MRGRRARVIAFRYRPEVDGLRAVAVLLVILYHAQLGFNGGFIGVDVFFVISGFLITGLIVKHFEEQTFTLKVFWGRRIRRIVPAATLVSISALVASAFLLIPSDLEDMSMSLIAQQTLVSNFYFWLNTGYFDGAAETKPLLHTWSLAVEEQFYLLYPIALWLLLRSGRQLCSRILMLVLIVSLLFSEWSVRNWPSLSFYLLPSRAWELLLGASVVFWPPPTTKSTRVRNLGAWLSLAAIVATGWFMHAEIRFPGFSATVPCFATAVFIYANSTASNETITGAGKLLAWRPFVLLGLMSYSLYLWHWPILALLRYRFGLDLDLVLRVVAIYATFMLSFLSWKYVETPFRSGFKQVAFKRIFSVATTTTLMVIAAGFWIVYLEGVVWNVSNDVRNAITQQKENQGYAALMSELLDGDLPHLGTENEPEQFLVWGDSHAIVLGEALNEAASEQNVGGSIAARLGAIPLIGVWRPMFPNQPELIPKWNDAVQEYIIKHDIKNIVLIARWAFYLEGQGARKRDPFLAAVGDNNVSHENSRRVFQAQLATTLEFLTERNIRVWIVRQIPYQPNHPERVVVEALTREQPIPNGVNIKQHQQRQRVANQLLDEAASRFSTVTVVDPAPSFYDDNGATRIGDEKGSYYRDQDHVSEHGAKTLLKPFLVDLVKSVTGSR